MQKQIKVIILAVLLSTLPACSSSDRRTTTTSVSEVPDSGSTGSDNRVVKTEIIESRESHNDDSGGGLFSIIGDIIAWPFRVVGATLSAIF